MKRPVFLLLAAVPLAGGVAVASSSSTANLAAPSTTAPLVELHDKGGSVKLYINGALCYANIPATTVGCTPSTLPVTTTTTVSNTTAPTSTTSTTTVAPTTIPATTTTTVPSAVTTTTTPATLQTLVISRGKPAFATSGIAGNANDADYETSWQPGTSGTLAYDLSSVPAPQRSNVTLSWFVRQDDGYATSSSVITGLCPASAQYRPIPTDYTIEANAAAGGPVPTAGWVALSTVTGNVLISRQQPISLAGYNWVRLNVSKANGTSLNVDVVNGTNSIVFYGDSITARYAGHNRTSDGYGNLGPSIADQILATTGQQFATQNAGMDCTKSTDMAAAFDRLIALYPGKYVALGFGTNDSWQGAGDPQAYYNTMAGMVTKLVAAGKTPVIATIPWPDNGGTWDTQVQAFNTKIQALYVAFPQIVHGPDLYTLTKGQTAWFENAGNVHPNASGTMAYRKAWAATLSALAGTTAPPVVVTSGHFATLPPGSALPDDATCAAAVRPATEVRASNATANATTGAGRKTPADPYYARVTGNYTGTTDQIIQWAACKWGLDEDIVRAQVAKESWWNMSQLGDFGIDPPRCAPGHTLGSDGQIGMCPESIGLLQLRFPYWADSFPTAETSSAYNLDYSLAARRQCFEGGEPWLNTLERGQDYVAGDLWGCIGRWFSGRWHTTDSETYIAAVKGYLNQRIWTTSAFLTG